MSRRLTTFSAVLGVAAAVVVALIVASSDGGEATATAHRTPTRDVTRILHGIPQQGLVLGDPKAPVLLVEFADLQCPFCREFAATSWPDIVQKYIRTGKVRMELRLTNILGEDSVKANKAVMAAGLQNHMWDASMRFYDVQGQEGSGYVTDRFLRGVLSGVHGLDPNRAMRDRTSAAVLEQLAAVHSMQSRYAVKSTPTLMIGTDANDLQPLADGVVSSDRLAEAINAQLLKTI
ncbi:MAG TPA: thioredoxin domain-containing protein [Baekduia sp.]